jgi:hypothetical protein
MNEKLRKQTFQMWANLGDAIAAYVEGGTDAMDSPEMAKECIQMAELAVICYRNASQYDTDVRDNQDTLELSEDSEVSF